MSWFNWRNKIAEAPVVTVDRVQAFIDQEGAGSVVDAIANNYGFPMHWAIYETGTLLSRLALEIAQAEQKRRDK
jgi:hypothetical protein